jgi:hypothetical protein
MSRLASIIAALCLATGAVAQTDTMQEQGFTPGMTQEQLLQQLKDKGAECTSGYIDGGINCFINGEEVAFAFTRDTPRRVSVITSIPAQRRSEGPAQPTVIYPKHFRPAPPSYVVATPTPTPPYFVDVTSTPTPSPWPYALDDQYYTLWIHRHVHTRKAPRPVERSWLTGRPRGERWLNAASRGPTHVRLASPNARGGVLAPPLPRRAPRPAAHVGAR